MFRLYSSQYAEKIIENLGNNLPEEIQKGNDNNNEQNEHVYKTIVEAEDVVSEEEFQDLKSKTHLDKEYHKLLKHKIKRIWKEKHSKKVQEPVLFIETTDYYSKHE